MKFYCLIIVSFLSLPSFGQNVCFKPLIGVCNNIEIYLQAGKTNCGYLEESVGGFLMPAASEEKFNEKPELAKQKGIKITGCNSFIPGSLKSVGHEANHDSILKYIIVAFDN